MCLTKQLPSGELALFIRVCNLFYCPTFLLLSDLCHTIFLIKMPKKGYLSDKSITNLAIFYSKNTPKCTSFSKFKFHFFDFNVHYFQKKFKICVHHLIVKLGTITGIGCTGISITPYFVIVLKLLLLIIGIIFNGSLNRLLLLYFN